MIQFDRIEVSERIDLDEADKWKECKICQYNYFDNCCIWPKKNCNRCDWGIKPFGKFAVIYVNDFSYRFFMFGMTEEDVIEFRKGFEPCDEFQTMLQYERTDISEGIDIDKTNASKECMLSH